MFCIKYFLVKFVIKMWYIDFFGINKKDLNVLNIIILFILSKL